MEVGDGVDDALRVSDGEGVPDVLEAVQRRRRYPVREVGQNAAQKLSDCLVGELVLVEDGVVLAQFVVAASRSLGYNSWSWNVCLPGSSDKRLTGNGEKLTYSPAVGCN